MLYEFLGLCEGEIKYVFQKLIICTGSKLVRVLRDSALPMLLVQDADFTLDIKG